MNEYKVSSYCSFYNGEKFIKDYISDLLGQSFFENTEFIFLDCNSQQNEKQIILPLADEFKNIKYFKLSKDPGLYASWNIAVKKCSAPIITNWNIDDRKNKESVEILFNALNKDESLDLVYGYTYISQKPNEKYTDNSFDQIYPCEQYSLKGLIQNNSPHCMPMWRKRIHEKYGYFNENYKVASDADMWLRCAINGAKIKMINHPVGLYYHNPDGASTNPKKLKESIQEVSEMRKKYIKYIL
jgi:glycosyltransferase involved in cell wall biosynthesis